MTMKVQINHVNANKYKPDKPDITDITIPVTGSFRVLIMFDFMVLGSVTVFSLFLLWVLANLVSV